MADWDLLKKEQLKSNWDDEDLDDVKESWEYDDEPAPRKERGVDVDEYEQFLRTHMRPNGTFADERFMIIHDATTIEQIQTSLQEQCVAREHMQISLEQRMAAMLQGALRNGNY